MTETITPTRGLSLPGLENIQAKFRTAGQALRGGDKSDNEALRRELIKINSQFRQTTKIIQGDREALIELAQSDERVAKLLALSDDNRSQIISNKILDRAHITQQEAALLINNLKDTTGVLTELNRTFEVNVGDVVRNFGSLVADSRIDTESRRKMAQDISEFAQKSLDKEQTRLEAMDEIPLKQLEQLEKQQAALVDLNKTVADSPSSAEFEKNSDAISKLVARLGDQTTEIKTLTTLKNLNETMDSAVLTQDELRETLEKQVGGGKSFEELFKENPSFFSEGGSGGGVVSSGLAALGLGGLEHILAPTIGRVLNKSFGGIGRAFGGTRLGGLAARGIGRARALPGQIGTAASRGASRLGTAGLDLAGRGGRGALSAVGTAGRAAVTGARALPGMALGGAKGASRGLLSLGGKALGFAKFLGPLGAAIAVGKGIFDAVDGFNRAADIAGLKEGEEATFGQKIQAAASSSLSGLTFGLLDEKTIFQGIETIKTALGDGIEFLGKAISDIWDSVWGGLKTAFVAVKDFVLGGGLLGMGLRSLFGVDDLSDFFMEKLGKIGKSISGVFTSIGSFLTDSMSDIAKFFDPAAIFKAVTEWGTGLAESIKSKIGGLLDFLPGFGEEKTPGDLGNIPGVALTAADADAPALIKPGQVAKITTPEPALIKPGQVAKITTPEPAQMAEAPTAEVGGDSKTMEDIRDFLGKLVGGRDPVPVNIAPVSEKPPLDRRTDIGDGMLGMLSTILDG